jgi:hypothetical protein
MKNKEETHKCKENWYNDVDIRHEKINKEQWSWVLEQTWCATELEVEDGIADHEGATISTHTVLISYCPFCGIKLTEKQENTW